MLRVLLLLAPLLGSCLAQQDRIIINKQGCAQYLLVAQTNTTAPTAITQSIVLWQAIVLLLAFGFFALLISLLHYLVRRYVYYDSHLLDTFFDGGGDVNFGLIACSVIAKWAWSSSMTWSSTAVKQYGVVGHFWFAAGAAIHLLLFAIVAVEIRVKAPGAKTFLQVIRVRHGAMAHVILMFFAFFCHLMVCGMVLTEGTNILMALTQDLSKEVASIVIAIVIGMFTVVGGVGGGMYVAFFSCITLYIVSLVYMTDVFYDPLKRDGNLYGSPERIFDILQCGRGDPENENFSLMTFLSQNGMMEGILIIISGFSSMFVNQSFWQTSIAAKPNHSVWGFLTGGLVWFALPFCAAFAFGMSYWAMSIQNGDHLLSHEDAVKGLLPVYVSQQLLGQTGDFLMFAFTMVAMITTASGEVLGVSSIIIYDIYQTYITPFKPTPLINDGSTTIRKQKQGQNEEYLEYDRRCMILKHVVVICVCIFLIPITLALLAIGIDLPWMFQFLAVVVGSCVLPIGLAITWHRITGPGIVIGSVVGMAVAFIAWLSYASSFEGGLENFRENTGRTEVFLVGTATALGLGGLLCIIVSLSCGGCDQNLVEEEEWEKTRIIDNPIIPWTVKYAPDIGSHHMAKGKPHFYTIRRAFKWSEVSAYIFGVLLAVCLVLVWPACMLMQQVFSLTTFTAWTTSVTVWTVLALLFVILVPMIYEIVQTCKQAYYNRMWATSSAHGMSRLEEDPSDGSMNGVPAQMVRPEPAPNSPPQHDAYSTKTDSDFQSNVGPDATAEDKERWKTFIHLD